MNTPTIQQVREIYRNTDKTGKKILESLYGKYASSSVMDRVTDFENACTEIGTTPAKIFFAYPADEIPYGVIRTIVAALNEGWTPNWKDSSEQKWYPWFVFQDGRFVFSGVGYDCAGSGLGSRLCFRSRELAEYAGKEFKNLYNDFLTL